jgi:hypothetical protein
MKLSSCDDHVAELRDEFESKNIAREKQNMKLTFTRSEE